MGTAKTAPTAQQKASEQQKKKSTALGWIIALSVVAACVGVGIVNSDSSSSIVPPPTATERADTVAVLKRNAEAQGICYGWQLQESGQVISVGSNLGDGVPVASGGPTCPRWVQINANVTWTSSSSELSDYASIWMESSRDIDTTDILGVQRELERFGLTNDVFIDDPGWATTRAAVVLPLLMVERGAVGPVPADTAAPAAAPSPLPAAGNDLWRDRWGYTLAVAGLLLVTALLFTVGFVQRRRQRRAAAQPVPVEPGGGRTRSGP